VHSAVNRPIHVVGQKQWQRRLHRLKKNCTIWD